LLACITVPLAGSAASGGLRLSDGFELTELTSGPGNEGAVSAVILANANLRFIPPASSPANILALTVEGRTPADGCVPFRVEPSLDPLVGRGQPVQQGIRTWP